MTLTGTLREATLPNAPLRQPFARFRLSFAAMQYADGLCQVALPLAALGVSHRPSAVAAVAFAARLPWLVFAIPAGAVVDRCHRLRLMRLVNAVRAAVLVGLVAGLWSGRANLTMLLGAALTLGIAETLHDTAAHTVLPRLVPLSQLTRANGQLQAVEFAGNQLLGPAVGGLLAAAGLGLPVAAAAGLCLLSVAALKAIPLPQAMSCAEAERPRLRQALSLLFGLPTLRTYAMSVGAMNAALAAYLAVLPVVIGAQDRPRTYGLIVAAGGAGGLAVSLIAARLIDRLGPRTAVTLGCLAMALGLAAPGLSSNTIAVAGGLATAGLLVLVNVVTVTYRQRTVPDALLGRVTACYRLVAWGSLPLGAAVAGFAVERIPATDVCLAAALLVALCAPLLMTATRPPTAEAPPCLLNP